MGYRPGGRGPELIAVYSFFVGLTSLVVFLRVYCRAIVVKSFGLDDWFALFAWLCFVLFATFAITGAFHGTGQHLALIQPLTEFPVAMKWWWRCDPVYVLSNMALKASVALMLVRLTVVKTHKIVIWVALFITEVASLFYFLLLIFQCRPTAYFWTKYTGGKGSCINTQTTIAGTYAYSAITCVGDWTFAVIPFFIVWKLQMNARTKVVVAVILAMAAIASTATIVRIPYISTLANTTDFLYATTDVAIWSCSETGLGIAASGIATLRPLFRSFFSTQIGGGSTPPRNDSHPSKGDAESRRDNGAAELGMQSDAQKTAEIEVAEKDCGNTTSSGSISSAVEHQAAK